MALVQEPYTHIPKPNKPLVLMHGSKCLLVKVVKTLQETSTKIFVNNMLDVLECVIFSMNFMYRAIIFSQWKLSKGHVLTNIILNNIKNLGRP